MLSVATLTKARAEAARLDGFLRELHLEEQRSQLRRQRLEKERSRVQTLIDLCELAQHLADTPKLGPVATLTPVFPDRPNGPQFAGLLQPAPGSVAERRATNGTSVNGTCSKVVPALPGSQYRKPPNIPTINDMVVSALQDAASHGQPGLRAKEVADYVRQRWWPNAKASAIGSVAWRMAKDGRLEKRGSLYRLNGHAGPNAHQV